MLDSGDAELLIDHDDTRVRPGRIIACRSGELPAQLVRRPHVVVVQKGDPVGACRPYPGVPRPGQTLGLVVADRADPRVGLGHRPEACGGSIHGPVVDDHGLNPNVSLHKRRGERPLQAAPAVPGRNHDRHIGRHGSIAKRMRSIRPYLRAYRRLRSAGVTRSSLVLYGVRRRIRGGCNRLDLRSGESLASPVDEQLLTMFEEVWVDERYSPPGWRLPPGGLVIDIGANVGVFSLWAVRRAGARRVIAFEPTPSTVEALRANLAHNRLGEVSVSQQAVGANRGAASLYARGPGAMNTMFPIDVFGSRFKDLGLVDVVTLDDVFERFDVDRCDLLKLDCEGAEYDILSGASAATLAKIQAVVAEYHIGMNDGTPDRLRDSLEAAGFEVTVYDMVDAEGGHLHALRAS